MAASVGSASASTADATSPVAASATGPLIVGAGGSLDPPWLAGADGASTDAGAEAPGDPLDPDAGTDADSDDGADPPDEPLDPDAGAAVDSDAGADPPDDPVDPDAGAAVDPDAGAVAPESADDTPFETGSVAPLSVTAAVPRGTAAVATPQSRRTAMQVVAISATSFDHPTHRGLEAEVAAPALPA